MAARRPDSARFAGFLCRLLRLDREELATAEDALMDPAIANCVTETEIGNGVYEAASRYGPLPDADENMGL
jgi:hypothetical protein